MNSTVDNEPGKTQQKTLEHEIDEIEREVDEIEKDVDGIEKEVDEEVARTRRLQVVVYPSLAAFILLASYGFYLVYNLNESVYSLARDVAALTRNVNHNMDSIASSMQYMTHNSNVMAHATTNIQRDMWSLNNNVSTPFNAMNSMLPWGNVNNSPYYGSSGRVPYPPPVRYPPAYQGQVQPQSKPGE